MTKKILIATGGTGGHIFPALSLAKNLTKKNYNVQLTIDKRGLNYLKEYKNLNLLKFLLLSLLKQTFLNLVYNKNFFSIIKSVILLSFKGQIFLNIYIYIYKEIKFIIYENNLIIGKTNKYLLPFCRKNICFFQ